MILRRSDHPWPLLLAANRDEMRGRASVPPGRHWEDRPEVVAGLDLVAGGSWIGVNDHGVAASILNREGTLGSLPGKRSRGELVLEALDHAQASDAAAALIDLDGRAYRPFNLVVADPVAAYWLRHDGGARIRCQPISDGLHLLGPADLDDPSHPRVATYLPRFQAAAVPDPESGDWSAWAALMASRDDPLGAGPRAAMLQEREDGFETRSCSLIAVPRYPGFDARIQWLHADGRPDREAFQSVM